MSEPDTKTISNIEMIIKSKLTEHSNNRLLSIDTGITLDSLLLIHPSPQKLIKMIIDQRCTEDLILLFLVMGIAGNIVLREKPMINRNDLLEKTDAIINQMIRRESPDFDNFVKSLPNFQKNLTKTKMLVDGFIAAYEKKNFDISEYIASHRELLRLEVDSYLLSLVITAQKKATEKELQNLINAVQEMRTVLAIYREKKQIP